MIKLESQRLVVQSLQDCDAKFILELLNDPSFLENIGDKQVRDEEAAKAYIRNQVANGNEQQGYGMNLVKLRDGDIPMGICGLVNRPELSEPDLGFAFLPKFWGYGYAFEASVAVLKFAYTELQKNCLQGITAPENVSSQRLLEKLGFSRKGTVEVGGIDNVLYEQNKNDFARCFSSSASSS